MVAHLGYMYPDLYFPYAFKLKKDCLSPMTNARSVKNPSQV